MSFLKRRRWGDNYCQEDDQAKIIVLATLIVCTGGALWTWL